MKAETWSVSDTIVFHLYSSYWLISGKRDIMLEEQSQFTTLTQIIWQMKILAIICCELLRSTKYQCPCALLVQEKAQTYLRKVYDSWMQNQFASRRTSLLGSGHWLGKVCLITDRHIHTCMCTCNLCLKYKHIILHV